MEYDNRTLDRTATKEIYLSLKIDYICSFIVTEKVRCLALRILPPLKQSGHDQNFSCVSHSITKSHLKNSIERSIETTNKEMQQYLDTMSRKLFNRKLPPAFISLQVKFHFPYINNMRNKLSKKNVPQTICFPLHLRS